ncbi:AraC family transcriptional regulator [Paenibacillus sp. Soil766]|uniref:AraC family transcriptional regulator n=1 Tax=Paenibacillus sp. Soil766 TaxID=1736404 RepID=UPI00070AAB19|nr:AraC family transcriptional regulator [Paenibacillus sp. Soil766]KRF06056.1 AraC family transcriptional regulator [Paenibacillus sp. Soil766]
MKLPPIQIENMDIKLTLGEFVLNVLYVKFGYFYTSMHEHSHSQGSYEFHYIPTGRGTLIAQGKQFPITPGTLFMTGPDVMHEQITDTHDPMAEYCIFFEVLPGDSPPSVAKKSSIKETALSELLVSTPFWIGSDKGNMMELFEMLASELSRPSIGFHHMVTNILEMIIIRLIRGYKDHQSSLFPIPLKTLDDSRLLIIENCFLYQYPSITLKQLAGELGLSTRQTERTIIKQYGVSFKDKKLKARMNAASRLLKTKDMSIHAVAQQVGFSSSEQFSNAFKKYFGITATQYKHTQERS